MSHLDVDVFEFLLLASYPAVGLLAVEGAWRAFKFAQWAKLAIQGLASAGFAVAYVTLITAHWLTAIVLAALAAALFYQARRAAIDPAGSTY